MKSNSFTVEIEGCDRIEAIRDGDQFRLEVRGCSKLLSLLSDLRARDGKDITQWKLPEGERHEILLVRELILRARGEWQFPYADAELCHCRNVATQLVDRAILQGAHTPEVVSRRTSASTACGTCRPEVEKIIAYRLARAS